jgi:hypothetical protein
MPATISNNVPMLTQSTASSACSIEIRARCSISDLLCCPHQIAVVNDNVHTEGVHEAEVPLQGHGDDAQARELRKLDRVLPYGACTLACHRVP